MRRWFFLIATLVCPLSGSAQNVAVGEAAPDFTLSQLGGGTFSLGDFTGKVRFLDFFGST
jgi:peroxiredoxin